MRAIVVGGGIAGLTAAWRLTERARAAGAQLDLSLLEAEPRPGGHSTTILEDGFRVEAGPNAFLQRPRETHMLDLVRDLGLESRLVEARPAAKRRFVLLGGRLHRAPDSPPVLITSGVLSPWGKLRLLMEPWAARAPRDREETVYEFARRRIGREAAEKLVDAAVAGISAGDSRRLSVEAAFPLMIEMEREHGSLIRAMMARRREGTSRLLGFDGGMETLVGALRSRLGGALRAGCRVTSVRREGGAWRVACGDGPALEADALVLAVAAARAAELLEGFDPALAAALGEIPYAGIAMVALAYRVADIARPLDGYGYLVAASEGLDTLGVLWESSLFDGRAPEGHALLRVMMGGSRRPGVLALDEAELIARTPSRCAPGCGAGPPGSPSTRSATSPG
jgi:oxygen-dependent protoporphyrinogen oxidase